MYISSNRALLNQGLSLRIMRPVLIISFLSFTLWLGSCGRDEIQLPQQRLVGTVDGEEWEIQFANAFIFSSDLKYQIKFLSTEESGDDPCLIPSPGSPFVSMVIPLQEGSFSVPFPLTDESPRFHLGSGATVVAVSGFLEIFAIDGARIFGYLQAQLDDDNTVEGSFEAQICN